MQSFLSYLFLLNIILSFFDFLCWILDNEIALLLFILEQYDDPRQDSDCALTLQIYIKDHINEDIDFFELKLYK